MSFQNVQQPVIPSKLQQWMARASNALDRPLPLLIISGKCGSGKSSVVCAAAHKANVPLVEYGSDCTTRSHGQQKNSGIFSSNSSFSKWQQIVRIRALFTRVMFIDDADVLLQHVFADKSVVNDDIDDDDDDADADNKNPKKRARGGAKGVKKKRARKSSKRVTAEDFVTLASFELPIVMAVQDFYSCPLLRSLKSALKDKNNEQKIWHVKMWELNSSRMRDLLAREYPALSRKDLWRLSETSGGDVRLARNQALLCVSSTIEVPASASDSRTTITPSHSPFDHVNALLGFGGVRLPYDGDCAVRVLRTHPSVVPRAFHTHYLSAFPAVKTDLVVKPGDEDEHVRLCARMCKHVEEAADTFSALDVNSTLLSRGNAFNSNWGDTEQFDNRGVLGGDFVRFIGTAGRIRRLRALYGADDRLECETGVSFAGPLGGREESSMYENLRRSHELVKAIEQIHTINLAREHNLAGCSLISRPQNVRFERSGAIRRIFDSYAYLQCGSALLHGEECKCDSHVNNDDAGGSDENYCKLIKQQQNHSFLLLSNARAIKVANWLNSGFPKPWKPAPTLTGTDLPVNKK